MERYKLDLTKISTKRLLFQMMRDARKYGGTYYENYDNPDVFGSGIAYIEDIKAELDKREHIPRAKDRRKKK